MERAKQIEQSLSDLTGFKFFFKNLLFGSGKAKEAMSIYQSGTNKGVYKCYQIRSIVESGNAHTVWAFSTKGSIDDKTLMLLDERANQLSEEVIKAEDKGFPTIDYMMPPAGTSWNAKGDRTFKVAAITEGLADIYAFSQTALFFEGKEIEGKANEYVIFTEKDNEPWLYPLTKNVIEKAGF